MKNVGSLILLLVILSSCSTKPEKADLVPLDLLEYGVPVTIMAPDSADVKKSSVGLYQDVTVKKGDYALQILMTDALTTNMSAIKSDALKSAREEIFFSRLVKEEDNGFIFENKVDSMVNYDFRYLMVRGDKQYQFQADMMSQLSLEEAEHIYDSVKQN
ncbi:MAG: hypothetical protein AAF502_17790 [Bacteroidota bacterium]